MHLGAHCNARRRTAKRAYVLPIVTKGACDMPTLNLTDRAIKRKPPDTGILELWDTVVPGLALRIGYGGKRTYTVTTRINGRQVRRKVGTTATHKLTEAREAARDVLRNAALGLDPLGLGLI